MLTRQLCAVVLLVYLSACSGVASNPSGGPEVRPGAFAVPLKGVTVAVYYHQTPLANIPVEMYVGKAVESCAPFSQPCIKKVKGLASGTTGNDGKVELTARFSGLEIVCVEAYNAKKYSMVQECEKNFPNSVSLQFAL